MSHFLQSGGKRACGFSNVNLSNYQEKHLWPRTNCHQQTNVINIPSQNSCRPNFSGTNIFLGPANVDEVFADFESQGLEGPDAILQGASMQTAGLALLWSRVLAILRTGNKMQRMVYQRLFFSL